MSGLDGVWDELVTVALLGTDRRDPPSLPDGLLADLVADAVRPDPATRMLDTIAAAAAARRAAFVPLPAAPALQPPSVDDRLVVPVVAVAAWRSAVAEWPVLDDEWVIAVTNGGWRLPADALVDLLERTRRHPVARSRVLLAAGPAAPWLVEHFPEFAVTGRRPASLDPDQLLRLPELPIPPDLAELLPLDAATFVDRIVTWFSTQRVNTAQRAVLVNLLARCRPAVLVDASDALGRMSSGIAQSLAQMATARHDMLTALDLPVKPAR